MSLLEPRGHHAHQQAVEALVRDADLEFIPLKSAAAKLALVPAGTTITVTISSKLGVARTLEFTEAAMRAGYRVVPHLAARQVADATALRNFTGRLDDLGVSDLYVIGGDAPEPVGPYNSAADILDAMTEYTHGITSTGVACYPEGHPSISNEKLRAALHRAQPLADYMVSQLCFNSASIASWLTTIRSEGITLPLHLGVAAPMQIRKLAELSLKIGVGSSVRYLTKQHGFIGNMLRGSSYKPEQLLYDLGDTLSSPASGIERLHVFTFNQIAETVQWQDRVAEAEAV